MAGTLCDRVIGVVLYLLAALTHASAITVIVMLHIHEVAVAELVESQVYRMHFAMRRPNKPLRLAFCARKMSQCHAAGCTVLHAANMSTICEQVYVFESAFTEVRHTAVLPHDSRTSARY